MRFLSFFPDLIRYIAFRGRQIAIWVFLIFEFSTVIGSNLKREVVKRMFWGRNSFYRQFFHFAIVSITILAFVNGVSSRLSVSNFEESQALNVAAGSIGANDVSVQYGTVSVFKIKEAGELPFDVFEYTVQEGDTLDAIAKKFGLERIDSIIFATGLPRGTQNIKPNQILKIPPMDGVLYEVEKGDTFEKILKKVNNEDKETVIELNDLQGPDYPVQEGEVIFIPGADIPYQRFIEQAGTQIPFVPVDTSGISVPEGTFVSPVGDSSCSGYKRSRGWYYYHTGVDLAKKGGCWIRSVGEGTVTHARWGGGDGLGFYIIVKHPNGMESLYGHLSQISVKEGQKVKPGQKIGHMGNTGMSTGTHLHFSLSNNTSVYVYRNRINPQGIVPGV